MKKFSGLVLSFIIVFTAIESYAAEPPGYYTPLNNKKDAELKTAIYNLVRNFTQVSSYSALPTYFQRTDVRPEPAPDGRRLWWDMYGNIPLYLPSFSGLNREHSFPKSWWGGLTDIPAYVDLNHLYPSEAAANTAKNNYPLGEVSTSDPIKYNNGVTKVGYPSKGQGGGAQFVFEPANEYKGDFARTYFYMVTCYQNLTWKYFYMLQQNTYPTLNTYAVNLLLKWHRDDPVSEKEIARNDVVYSIQNNRNPFIDRPELAEYIWGDKKGQIYTGQSTSQGDPNLITPVQDMALDFGQVAIGQSITRELPFRGENLSGWFELMVYKGKEDTANGYKMFTTSSEKLNASYVEGDGTIVRVTYTPTELGSQTATLLVSGGGPSGSLGVKLRGECLPVPTLSACTATAASDITSESYRANWTYPENEVVDYWIINRTKYIGSSFEYEEIFAEEPGTIINDFNNSDKESYTVRSVRLGYKSPESNVIFVDHAGVTGVTTDEPLIVQGFEGTIRFVCSSDQTNARIFDMTGKPVMNIDSIHDNLDIFISQGIYMVVTDQCSRPVKVIVR